MANPDRYQSLHFPSWDKTSRHAFRGRMSIQPKLPMQESHEHNDQVVFQPAIRKNQHPVFQRYTQRISGEHEQTPIQDRAGQIQEIITHMGRGTRSRADRRKIEILQKELVQLRGETV